MKKSTVMETFNEWNQWIIEHENTPKIRSKDKNESNLANRMAFVARYIKEKNIFLDVLHEYKKKLKEYNKMSTVNVTDTVNEWIGWVEKNEIIPKQKGHDEYETSLHRRMAIVIGFMRKKPQKYDYYIKQYERLYSLYGRKQSKARRIEEFKCWVEKNKRLPKLNSSDYFESKLANNTRHIYYLMRLEPEKYSSLIKDYEEFCQKYYLDKAYMEILTDFNTFKNWVLTHEMFPSYTDKNDEHRAMYNLCFRTLRKMKRRSEDFATQLEEYEELAKVYKKGKQIKENKERFRNYKAWVEEHGHLPRQSKFIKDEKNIAWNASRLYKIMKQMPQAYAEELKEMERLTSLYKVVKIPSIKFIDTFNVWKAWCEKRGRLPRTSSPDKTESRLYSEMFYAINEMLKLPEVYSEIIKEYNFLKNKYGRVEKVKEVFYEWKEWCMTYKKEPKASSDNQAERTLYSKMSRKAREMQNDMETFEEMYEEYKRLKKQYK